MATRVVVVPSRRAARRGGWPEAAVGVGLVVAFAVAGHGHLRADLHAKATGKAPAAVAAAPVPAGFARQAATAIAYARQQIGKPYVYGAPRWSPGAPAPDSYDCSSLVQWAWAAAGVTLPGTSETQWAALPHITRAQLKPGDLIFETGSPIDSPPGHVYLYLGGGKGLEAYGRGVPVRIISVRWSDATGYARP